MKVTKYIFGLLFSLLLVSCDGDVITTKYESDNVGISFASAMQREAIVKGDVVAIPVYRGNSDSELTTPFTVEYANEGDQILSVKSKSIFFEKGQNVAYINIDYGDFDDLGLTTKYTAKFKLTDQDKLAVSGISLLTLNVQRKLTYNVLGEGSFASAIFEDSWAQEILMAEEAFVISLPDCYVAGTAIAFLVDEKMTTVLQFDRQETGYVDASKTMYYVEYVGHTWIGKTLTLQLELTGAGESYGVFEEVLAMP